MSEDGIKKRRRKMPLTNDSVIWTGKTIGITIENYNDKYSIKSVRKYTKGDQEVITYDWIFTEEYDKEQRKRVVSTKPRPCNIYLGPREEAIKALQGLLKSLGVNTAPEQGDIPF
jgi:hypothetical protein